MLAQISSKIAWSEQYATKTPITPEQRSHGDPTVSKKNADCRSGCKPLGSNTVASPVDAVGSHRMPADGAHFKHAQTYA